MGSGHHKSGCPRYLVGLSILMIFSVITTTLLGTALCQNLLVTSNDQQRNFMSRDFFLGPCLIHTNTVCPDEEITFFLYTQENPVDGEQVFVNQTDSNLGDTNFDANSPTKIVVHGYNSDMHMDVLVNIRNEYLAKEPSNLIAVDWHRLAVAPCYPTAVRNVPHVGDCLAQLIQRLRDRNATDIHLIGFSLGAHVPAFAANALSPYKVNRITGLDPAMPLFITVDKKNKLDASDAEFVDVFHTNALVQGKLEASGHIDFYMNGGVNQPGCWRRRNPFGCNHVRAPMYFAESINSKEGFWGWPCAGFVTYLLGFCPPTFPAVRAGDAVDRKYKGFHIVRTRAVAPFAMGPFTIDGPITNGRSIYANLTVIKKKSRKVGRKHFKKSHARKKNHVDET